MKQREEGSNGNETELNVGVQGLTAWSRNGIINLQEFAEILLMSLGFPGYVQKKAKGYIINNSKSRYAGLHPPKSRQDWKCKRLTGEIPVKESAEGAEESEERLERETQV